MIEGGRGRQVSCGFVKTLVESDKMGREIVKTNQI